MISPEYEQNGTVGFLEVVAHLTQDDGLVLGQGYVRRVHEGRVVREMSVHYEGLEHLSESYRQPDQGKLVTDEFQVAAEQILSEKSRKPQSTYPLMTVINNETEERITEVMDIARLIDRGELPVYARVNESAKSGEELSLGVVSLIEKMALKVGLNSRGVVIIDDSDAHQIDTAVRVRESHFSMHNGHYPVNDEPDIDRRGVAMLSLLQMDLAQAFIGSRHRITDKIDGYVEAVLRLTTRPDMQTMLLELIDGAESHHMHLHYNRGMTLMDEEGSTFTLVDDTYSLRYGLATERTLDMAVYNAYLVAVDIFKRMD